MQKTYIVDNSNLGREIIISICCFCVEIFLVYPLFFKVIGLIWQKEMHGFAILLKIIGLLFTIAVLVYLFVKPLYDIYYSAQRTLYEKNAELTIDEDNLTMTYKNDHLEQKQVSFSYSDIAEILQRTQRYVLGHYVVTLKSGESFIITAYMEGFVPIARKFGNEYPDNYTTKGGNILLPYKYGSFFRTFTWFLKH